METDTEIIIDVPDKLSTRSSYQRLLIVAFMTLLTCALLSCSQSPKAIPRAPVITNHDATIAPLWERHEYFIGASKHPQVVASKNKLFMIGSASISELPSLIALDANTGDISWQHNDTSVNVLATSETTLYVGGFGQVTALEPDTGRVIWSTVLPSRSVTKIFIDEDLLYVDTIDGSHFIVDVETGKILQKIDYSIDSAPNPDVPLWSDHNMDLDSVGHTFYFQAQTGLPAYRGDIIATDGPGGNQLWKSSSLTTITRVAASPPGIFVLDSDGNLLRFEPMDGTRQDIIQFTPAPSQATRQKIKLFGSMDIMLPLIRLTSCYSSI
jgi:hypothetical protein